MNESEYRSYNEEETSETTAETDSPESTPNNEKELDNYQKIHKELSSKIKNLDFKKVGKNSHKLKDFRTKIQIQKSNSDSYGSGTNNTEQSLEFALLNNPRLPDFLAGISDVYEKKTPERIKGTNMVIDAIYEKKGISREKSDVEENGRIPLFEEYILKYDTQENFDKFLLSEEFRKDFFLEYIRNHTNNTSGEIYYSATDATTQAGLAWMTHLYHEYKKEYPTGDDDNQDKRKNTVNTLNQVKNHIDRIVINSISNGSNLKDDLDKVFKRQKELSGNMSDSQKAALEEYNIPQLLRESIKMYFNMSENINLNHPLQKTGQEIDKKIFDTKLRAYLYLYANQYSKFENKGGTLEDYEEELNEVLKVILFQDGKIKNIGDNKYLQDENELNNRMAEAQREARNKAIEWNRRVNSNIGSGPHMDRQQEITKGGKENLNYQVATGAEIAEEKKLSEKLESKIKREPSETEKTFLNKIAFRRTCKDFILSNNDLKDFVSIGTLQKFFIIGENGVSFNQRDRDSFKLKWLEKNGSGDLVKLDKIENLLKGTFPIIFNEIKEGTIDSASYGMEKVDKVVKNHAIGAVIDNIKDALDGLSKFYGSGQGFESFKYNKDPVEIEGKGMIISGSFGGNDVKVYYDTVTGDLSIKSNSNISEDGGVITVGKKSLTKKVGTIKPFDDILNDFYNNPTDEIGDYISKPSKNNSVNNSDVQNTDTNFHQLPSRKLHIKEIEETGRLRLLEICGTQIDKIGNIVENELGREVLVNGIVTSLFRTLNIFSDNTNNDGKTNEEKTLNLKGNNIYQFIKMVQNSDNKTLYKFQEEMPEFMNCFGLSWGKNNYQQNKENNLNTIFNSTLDGEMIGNGAETKLMDIGYLRQISDNFNKECENIKEVPDSGIIGEDYNSGILKILINNFSSTNNTLKCINADSIKKFSESLKEKVEIKKNDKKDEKEKRDELMASYPKGD